MTTVLIDYGSGNLHSAKKALDQVAGGEDVLVTAEPLKILHADRIMLPGVGAFSACMDQLEARSGLIWAMTEAVNKGVPFLGVCVGMQLLASRGLEFGERAGLDLIPGEVAILEPSDRHFKVPHMGWNALSDAAEHPLFDGIDEGAHMYFTHSYALTPSDPAHVLAKTDHGGALTAAVARDNIAGVQFHPEKSQAAGLKLLSNFLRWKP